MAEELKIPVPTEEGEQGGPLEATKAALEAEMKKAEQERAEAQGQQPEQLAGSKQEEEIQASNRRRQRKQQRGKQPPPRREPEREPQPEPVAAMDADEQLDATMWDRITRLELDAEHNGNMTSWVRTVALAALMLAVALLFLFVIFRTKMLPGLIAAAVKSGGKAPLAAK